MGKKHKEEKIRYDDFIVRREIVAATLRNIAGPMTGMVRDAGIQSQYTTSAINSSVGVVGVCSASLRYQAGARCSVLGSEVGDGQGCCYWSGRPSRNSPVV